MIIAVAAAVTTSGTLAAVATCAVESASGDALLAAMKGMSWMSPRGPVSIDPETRDIVQNIYVRKVEKKDGALYNVEFATIPNVKDPYKAAKR